MVERTKKKHFIPGGDERAMFDYFITQYLLVDLDSN